MADYIFKMPDIGEGIVEAEVVAWHVAVGDRIEEDSPLADVMTDKATVEITSPVSGVVKTLGCAAGDKMVIGADFVVFDTDQVVADEIESSQSPRESQSEPNSLPDSTSGSVGETASSGKAPDDNASTAANNASESEQPDAPAVTHTSTSAKPKIRVVSDAGIADGQKTAGSKAEENASARSIVSPIRKNADAKHGTRPAAAGTQEDRANSRLNEEKPAQVVDWRAGQANQASKKLASPSVRKFATDNAVEVEDVDGTGPGGRVLKRDIEQWLRNTSQQDKNVSRTSVTDKTSEAAATTGSDSTNVVKIPVLGMRRLIAERMQASKQNIPHFSYIEEVDVTALESLRHELNLARADDKPKLSLLHFILLAVTRVVPRWPQCNAHYSDDESALLQFDAIHLGVATMTDNGLMVPVIRNAETLDIWQLAAEVKRLATQARDGSLGREELTGSTITVTSLGPLAGVATTPVINRPETSIIGPNKMMQKVVMREGQPQSISVMNISSSFDHRVVDGYDAASMIQALREMLEQPAMLFIPDLKTRREIELCTGVFWVEGGWL